MIDKYIALNRALRTVGAAAREAIEAEMFDSDGVAPGTAFSSLARAVSDLRFLWPAELNQSLLDDLIRVTGSSDHGAYQKIL